MTMRPFDLKNENYPGHREGAGLETDRIPEDAVLKKHGEFIAFLKRSKTSVDEKETFRNYLSDLPDEEVIGLYEALRDEKIEWEEGFFYPNIQYLFGTAFEREKDYREQQLWRENSQQQREVTRWYEEAKEKSCVWWIENHIISRHSISSCMSCGACTALCPAAEFYDFSPRMIMTIVQEKDEAEIIELLKSDTIWYCHQCGSCKPKCPRGNSPFGMISSLRQLSQIKGYHVESVRGRQQFAARHLWGGNLWNRACTLYFRNPEPIAHRDFGPRFALYFKHKEEMFRRIGACPDMDGSLSGRKVHPDTLDEVRKLWQAGGVLYLWERIEEAARRQAEELGISLDSYHEKVKSEG